jgi:hypothetical protein
MAAKIKPDKNQQKSILVKFISDGIRQELTLQVSKAEVFDELRKLGFYEVTIIEITKI